MRLTKVLLVAVVAVLAGASTLVIAGPAQATGTGSISGTVRQSGTNAPLGGVQVTLIGTTDHGFFGTGPGFVNSTTTATNGTYSFTGLAADPYYQVCFGPSGAAANDEGQCWNNETWFPQLSDVDPAGFVDVPGDNIAVADGQQVTKIDGNMIVAATISGTVTDALTGHPLSGAQVTVGGNSSFFFGGVQTAADGTYAVHVPADPDGYQVCVSPSNAYANACTSTAAIATSQQVTGVNFALGPNTTSISGKVRFADTGAPAAGANVTLFFLDGSANENGEPNGQLSATTKTAANGTYAFTQLPQYGTNYDVCFSPATASTKYFSSCYSNQFWGTTTGDSEGDFTMPANATNVSPAALQSITNINGTLPIASITGKVTQSPLGAPLAHVRVEILGPSAYVIASAYTSKTGAYTVAGLHAGNYYVCFDGSTATGGTTIKSYIPQCWHNVTWTGTGRAAAGSTAVTVNGTHTVANINAAMRASLK